MINRESGQPRLGARLASHWHPEATQSSDHGRFKLAMAEAENRGRVPMYTPTLAWPLARRLGGESVLPTGAGSLRPCREYAGPPGAEAATGPGRTEPRCHGARRRAGVPLVNLTRKPEAGPAEERPGPRARRAERAAEPERQGSESPRPSRAPSPGQL